MYCPTQALFSGPVDIVGDVHGEIGALRRLLDLLGYDSGGAHADGRRLVFVGDLIDRGEDSPAVVALVKKLVNAGKAQCVLGNHELNILRGLSREGNGWFFPRNHDRERGHFLSSVDATPRERRSIYRWMRTLPLVLEREDLRVVHAAWSPSHGARLATPVRKLRWMYRAHSEELAEHLQATGLTTRRDEELNQWGDALRDADACVPTLPGIQASDVAQHELHASKGVTCGLETATAQPYFAAGKWRLTQRAAWWNSYQDEKAIVFGHYWRWPGSEDEAAAQARGPNLFSGSSPFEWLGLRQNAMCVDWCAGLRWRERVAGAQKFRSTLGALRWPERQVVLENPDLIRDLGPAKPHHSSHASC